MALQGIDDIAADVRDEIERFFEFYNQQTGVDFRNVAQGDSRKARDPALSRRARRAEGAQWFDHLHLPAAGRTRRSGQAVCEKSVRNAKCVGRYRPIGNASIKNPSQTSGWTRRCSLPGPRTQLMFSSEGVVTA